MKISLNEIRGMNQRYDCAKDIAPNGIDDLVKKIGAQLGGIDEVIDLGKKYQGIVVASVVSCEKHPNADKLSLCKIDDGGVVQEVARDSSGHVQVVCGAPNVREGLLVAWLPPGAIVPATYDKDRLVLEAREIRGQVSNGMLASASELGLSDDHSGILEITDDAAKPGDNFAKTFGLDDYIIDIENKMFTHRPDLFGFLGVARELAGIQQMPFKSPGWYTPLPEFPQVEAEELKLEVKNEIPELVPRFVAITVRGVQLGPSPLWLQIFLAKMGIKSINNIVDYSNFFMMETAQPIHIYDYDKVRALSGGDHAIMVIRHPKAGETITALSGKIIEPSAKTMMVATDQKLICVGGAIGGAETEVDANTKNIIIEAANWDMFQMRRTAMEHGIFTDAVTRFTKGQSPHQNLAVVAKIVDEIRKHADGKVASSVIDIHSATHDESSEVLVAAEFINSRLGLALAAEEIMQILQNVEFVAEITRGDVLVVKPPFWRTDIQIAEDIVEEVGRLYGYDHLPLDLPRRAIVPVGPDRLLSFKQRVRLLLAASGANEVLTYSFVHGNLLERVNQEKQQAYEITNALSPDLQYYRLSLTPNILDKIHPNIKAGYKQFALFELGKTHIKGFDNEEGLPREFERLAFVVAAEEKSDYARGKGAPYFTARTYLMNLLASLGLDDQVRFEIQDPADTDSASVYYRPGRVSRIMIGDKVLGRIGEYKASVQKALKLPSFCAGFELGLELLLQAAREGEAYKALSKFPSLEQDISLRLGTEVSYQTLFDAAQASLERHKPQDIYAVIAPIDIYSPDEADQKHIALRFIFTSYERTLTDALGSELLEKIAQDMSEKLRAERL